MTFILEGKLKQGEKSLRKHPRKQLQRKHPRVSYLSLRVSLRKLRVGLSPSV